MTMSKLLLPLLALSLCFAAACATSPDAVTDTDDTATDTAVLTPISTGQAQVNGASCTIQLPFGWQGTDGAACTVSGHIPVTILDTFTHTFTSVGPNAGSCTYRCIDGTLMTYDCSCVHGGVF